MKYWNSGGVVRRHTQEINFSWDTLPEGEQDGACHARHFISVSLLSVYFQLQCIQR